MFVPDSVRLPLPYFCSVMPRPLPPGWMLPSKVVFPAWLMASVVLPVAALLSVIVPAAPESQGSVLPPATLRL